MRYAQLNASGLVVNLIELAPGATKWAGLDVVPLNPQHLTVEGQPVQIGVQVVDAKSGTFSVPPPDPAVLAAAKADVAAKIDALASRLTAISGGTLKAQVLAATDITQVPTDILTPTR